MKTLSTLIFALFLQLYLQIGVKAAETADEIIYISFETPEVNELWNVTTRFKRVNKTHQGMTGFANYIIPMSIDFSAEINFFRQDHGGWHPLAKRVFKNFCSQFYMRNGLYYPAKKLYLPNVPDGCPTKPGIYNLTQKVLPRYRKEWPSEFQAMVPLMIPSADKWKIETKIFRTKDELLSTFIMEFRFINRFMSQ